MPFTLSITDLGNAEFGESTYERGLAIGRLLRKAAVAVEQGNDGGVLLDVNGNTVGSFTFDVASVGEPTVFVVPSVIAIPADADNHFVEGLCEEVASDVRGQVYEALGRTDPDDVMEDDVYIGRWGMFSPAGDDAVTKAVAGIDSSPASRRSPVDVKIAAVIAAVETTHPEVSDTVVRDALYGHFEQD